MTKEQQNFLLMMYSENNRGKDNINELCWYVVQHKERKIVKQLAAMGMLETNERLTEFRLTPFAYDLCVNYWAKWMSDNDIEN